MQSARTRAREEPKGVVKRDTPTNNSPREEPEVLKVVSTFPPSLWQSAHVKILKLLTP